MADIEYNTIPITSGMTAKKFVDTVNNNTNYLEQLIKTKAEAIIKAGAITNDKIAEIGGDYLGIEADKIKNGTITSSKLASNIKIEQDQIAKGAISEEKLDNNLRTKFKNSHRVYAGITVPEDSGPYSNGDIYIQYTTS